MLHDMHNVRNPTHAQELVTLRTGRELPDLLREMYIDRRLSQEGMAEELGVARMTVAMWLREFGITRAERAAPLEELAG